MAAGGLYAQMFGEAEAGHCDFDAVPVPDEAPATQAGRDAGGGLGRPAAAGGPA